MGFFGPYMTYPTSTLYTRRINDTVTCNKMVAIIALFIAL